MTSHPYKSLPQKAFWKRSVAGLDASDLDPVGPFELKIAPSTRVATAGSCFAQHIARHLQRSGFCYYVTEAGHPVLPASIREAHNYGLFTARYGNIYTARQLLQMMQRAYGEFVPKEDIWTETDGRVLDPFRPTTQPGGYISEAELRADRKQHLAAVRAMFETCDVFVFTLGLTECWRSREDGAVFPLCPGVEGGVFSSDRHEFLNQTVDDVISDMTLFLERLKRINPTVQVMLTVSPVPLMATAEPDAHVLAATTYSKSVLRVAAEMLRQRHDFVHYFPSYEIITGAYTRGRYFADDLRNVVETGVSHVMRLFLKHAAGVEAGEIAQPSPPTPQENTSSTLALAAQIVAVECDEEALDRS